MKRCFYIWQNDGWPRMQWDETVLSPPLAEVNTLRGRLLGMLSMFGFQEQEGTMLDALTQEIVESAKIEGEQLNRDSVRSSVARQLGLNYDGLPVPDHYTEGVVQVMIDATQHYMDPITDERLFSWHRALFPMGQSGIFKITVGSWREGDEPMQVVSGAMGHEKVHYEAPACDSVGPMMHEFLVWLNDDALCLDPIVKAAVAHLWFVTIHPFDDGNGRLCRTITEYLLSRADNTPQRYYSLSAMLLSNRKQYYEQLERAQHGDLDVTQWVEWFVGQIKCALEASLQHTKCVVEKTHFWNMHRDTPFNDRQRKVLNMLLDGFDGKVTSSKWYKICHCSQDTATRDIKDLVDKGILCPTQDGGRSTGYLLKQCSNK